MENIKVSEMPQATTVNENDLIMIVQGGENKKVAASLVSAVPKENKIYTVKRLISNNSSSLWERGDDSVGLVSNATKDGSSVQNDFDNIYPWSDIISYNYDTQSERITAFYGEPMFDFSGNNGIVLTKIPEFWYKRYRDNTYEYISISDGKQEGYIKSEQFSIGRYICSGSASGVTSISGVEPFVNYNITSARTYTRAVGNGFGQLDWHIFLIQILYLVEYADYNSQTQLGQGRTLSSNTSPNNSGGCDSLGMKSGCLGNDGTFSMIYRGIEDVFGNIWQFIDGINIKDYVAYISYNSKDYVVDKFTGSYKSLGYTNAQVNGWQTQVGYDSSNPLIDLSTAVGGSSSTYMTDYYYCASGNKVALFGGFWIGGAGCGLWFWRLNSTSTNAHVNVGCRLLFNQ